MALRLLPEPIAPVDHRQVLRRYQHNPHFHLHLDWHTLDQWLPHSGLRCHVLREGGQITALLGATLQTPYGGDRSPIAWLRFMFAPRLVPNELFNVLWESLLIDLKAEHVQQVAVLAAESWVGHVLREWGFNQINTVVTLQKSNRLLPQREAGSFSIREASHSDLKAIATIDRRAFDNIWNYDLETLEIAYRQAATVTIIERQGQPSGYQLSTEHARAGHLARLAVLPEAQGRGLGRQLVGEMLRYFSKRGITTFTVNTQSDNVRSLRLYQHLGFQPAGEGIPVWSIRL